MFSILRDLYEPDYRLNVLPRLLDDYSSPFQHSHPHVHLNLIRRQPSTSDARQSDDANKFQVMLNVKHFSPDEIDVKTVDNYIVIHGKHEEQADEHGFVSREFTRRYQLPDDVEPDKVKSSLSRDGVLTVTAPRKALPPPKNERIVPITIQQPAAVEEAQKQQQIQQEQQNEPMQQ